MSSVAHADHGPVTLLASNGLGQVSACSCGVLTLTVSCVSLRLEPAAFAELAALVLAAHRLQARAGAAAVAPDAVMPEAVRVH